MRGENLSEFDPHSLIVKVWVEETAEEAGQVTWRGHITHVPSGKRRYLEHLDEIAIFIAPYLEGMGVKLGLLWQVRRWLSGCKIFR